VTTLAPPVQPGQSAEYTNSPPPAFFINAL
jgi:hypothetical protein